MVFQAYTPTTNTEEGFLISSCYSLELCIQMLISFLFSEMQYSDTISKTTEWSLFISRANHSISVIQVYAPTSNAEETEVERFYEDLQDLLEQTPKKMYFSL